MFLHSIYTDDILRLAAYQTVIAKKCAKNKYEKEVRHLHYADDAL